MIYNLDMKGRENIDTMLAEEIELKLYTPKDAADKMAAGICLPVGCWSGPPRRQELRAVYYDTRQQSLQRIGAAVRVRQEDKSWVLTIKMGGGSQGGLHQRQEWNVRLASSYFNSSLLSTLPPGRELSEAIGEQTLEPLFATDIVRTVRDIEWAGRSGIEFALDQGAILSGAHIDPVHELELELKHGRTADVLYCGAFLAQQFPLFIEQRSKFSRGLALAGLADVDTQPRKGQENGRIGLLTAALEVQAEIVRSTVATNEQERIDLLGRLLIDILASNSEVAEQESLLFRQIAQAAVNFENSAAFQLGIRSGRLTGILLRLWGEMLDINDRG